MDKIKIYNVKWTSYDAGPSPDNNRRTELFLSGCNKASKGNPCPGCFNPDLFDPNRYVAKVSAEEAYENIIKNSPNKFITIVGGEPLDQIEPLTALCKLLKEDGYHIIVFTHYVLKDVMKMNIGADFLSSIDILIDGEFKFEEKIQNQNEYEDGFHNVVGSGNQVIWDIQDTNFYHKKFYTGYYSRDLVGLFLNNNHSLTYITYDEDRMELTCYDERSIAV